MFFSPLPNQQRRFTSVMSPQMPNKLCWFEKWCACCAWPEPNTFTCCKFCSTPTKRPQQCLHWHLSHLDPVSRGVFPTMMGGGASYLAFLLGCSLGMFEYCRWALERTSRACVCMSSFVPRHLCHVFFFIPPLWIKHQMAHFLCFYPHPWQCCGASHYLYYWLRVSCNRC